MTLAISFTRPKRILALSLRQRAAVSLRGEADEDEADEIDQAHRGTGERIAAVQLEAEKAGVRGELRHQIAGLQDADGRQNAAEIITESLAGRAHARAKQLR